MLHTLDFFGCVTQTDTLAEENCEKKQTIKDMN